MNNETIINLNGYDTVKDNLTPITEVEDIDDYEVDDSFNYEGFQVVRGEFFAHIFEPSLTFNRGRISVNMLLAFSSMNTDTWSSGSLFLRRLASSSITSCKLPSASMVSLTSLPPLLSRLRRVAF